MLLELLGPYFFERHMSRGHIADLLHAPDQTDDAHAGDQSRAMPVHAYLQESSVLLSSALPFGFAKVLHMTALTY